MSVTHLGQPLKQPESQLAISLLFAQHLNENTLPSDHYKQARDALNKIMSVISKKDAEFVLQTEPFKGCLIEHEFPSLDACFARFSLFAYSKTTVWTIALANGTCFTLMGNDSAPLEPLCALFVPSTGDYHVFKGGLDEAKGCVEGVAAPAAAEAAAGKITAHVWKPVVIKQEAPPPVPTAAEAAVGTGVQEDVIPEPVEDIVITPCAPPPPQAAAEAVEPAAPVKKKIVRKRPTPASATPESSEPTKKQTVGGGAE